jgi:hypothetical protein
MPTTLLVLPLGAAIVLIGVGRLKHTAGWGNWVAFAGYALLARSHLPRSRSQELRASFGLRSEWPRNPCK